MGKEQAARVRRAVVQAVVASAVVMLTSTILVFSLFGELVSAITSSSLSYAVLGARGGGTAFVAAPAVWAAVRAVRRTAERIQTVCGRVNPEDLAELTESRREIVAVFEIERRHIEHDLHDGVQQYLVAASIDIGEAGLLLGLATTGGVVVPEKVAKVRAFLGKAQDDAESALRALRDIAAGIHPKVLSDLGLETVVRLLVASLPLKVEVSVPNRLPTIPGGVVAAAYFLVSEGLMNVAKYAPAAHVSVLLAADENLHVSASDDDLGGASVQPDRGLFGMRGRLAAFGGILEAVSPSGGLAILTGRIPLPLRQGGLDVAPVKGREGVGETGDGTGVGEAGDDASSSAPEMRRTAKADW